MLGILYFIVIVFANTIGSISGMGGGIIIKPIFDFIGAQDVATISFYSTTAVFTMSIISILSQYSSGHKFNWQIMRGVSIGAVLGGFLGDITFELFLSYFENKVTLQLIQIVLTVITLLFAFLYTKYNWKNFLLTRVIWYYISGLFLGFLASLLGIGGGPINVSLLMLLFSIPIKDATVYSIGTIFFSQSAKLITIALNTGFNHYDLTLLKFTIPAAFIGGFLGAKCSNVLSSNHTTIIFQYVVILVLFINFYNAYRLLM